MLFEFYGALGLIVACPTPFNKVIKPIRLEMEVGGDDGLEDRFGLLVCGHCYLGSGFVGEAGVPDFFQVVLELFLGAEFAIGGPALVDFGCHETWLLDRGVKLFFELANVRVGDISSVTPCRQVINVIVFDVEIAPPGRFE